MQERLYIHTFPLRTKAMETDSEYGVVYPGKPLRKLTLIPGTYRDNNVSSSIKLLQAAVNVVIHDKNANI